LKNVLSKNERKEAARVFNIYKENQIREQAFSNSKSPSLRQQQISRKIKTETVMIPHFQDKPVAVYSVDPLLYLSTFMGNFILK
jgi:hypothetical protein